MSVKSKAEAQKRADQIESFRAELDEIEQAGVVVLATEQRSQVVAYHETLLSNLSKQYDIDSSKRAKQLSLGMKITSFLGALALGASLFFLFYQFWGSFSTNLQVVTLIVAPLLGLLATMFAAQREQTGYFAKLFGMVSVVSFVLNLSMLGQIFNIIPSENAFLVWAIFAFTLAYAIDARLLLSAGIICISAYLSARMGTWSGCYWIDFGQRPENFLPAALLLSCLSYLPHQRFAGFTAIYRAFALLLFFVPVLILANWGRISYLDFSSSSIEILYQIIGFMFSGAVVWLGIRKSWPEMVNIGNIFFTIFLYTKFYDWWWDWMPKYLFFLMIALAAILMLLIFKRLRSLAVAQARRETV